MHKLKLERGNLALIVFSVLALVVNAFFTDAIYSQSNPTEILSTEVNSTGSNTDATSEKDTSDKQVLLAFRDQQWLPALQWLAKELEMNLDWQTLPEGEFSLHSTQSYSLAEAEDLINMQLLARGFTLLKRGEVLRIVPLKEIDITLVPRIEADDLEELQPHTFARVSFPLEWMIAEEAAEEFKPLLSPYGNLSPMRSSNRLEVMDAVVNLREMHRLLVRAEADDARRERVAEFKLKYRQASDVAQSVRQLLGLGEKVSSSTQSQLDIEQARFKAEAVKQMGSGATELIKDRKPDVFLTVNEKENSILCNAPPNKIEIVRQAIEAMDKPLPEGDSTWATLSRVKVHEVEGFDPTAITTLLTSIQERGNLAKDARIQYESAYNRIIAFASADDQLTIAQVIESFRAKRRSANVLPLGSIDAEYAVKAIQLILKNPDRPPTAPGVASDGKFQAEADPENRRLLLWASAEEVKEVQDFLVSLGDNKTGAEEPLAQSSNLYIVPLNGVPLQKVSPKLKNIWKDLSDAPLVIESDEQDNDVHLEKKTKPSSIEVTEQNKQNPIRLVSNSETVEVADSDSRDPVRIVEGEQGEAIILSRDPLAAQSARKLLERLLPGQSQVAVIPLQYSQAVLVKRQLEEMLEPEQPSKLLKLTSPPVPLKIDADLRTNRLLVQNASEEKLRRIERLVEVLDQPVAADDRLARIQRVYRFQHRKAEEVASMVKEVYRDLLSLNDRVFITSTSTPGTRSGYNQNLAATASNPEYQGLLAVGVDNDANLLVVSAPRYLIDEVMELIESVDTPSDGNSVQLLEFSGGTKDSATREALSRILGNRKR